MTNSGNCATNSLSMSGTLATPEAVFQQTFTLSATSNLRIVTLSFGGGINAAGQVIPPGGFDPLVALFSGPPATASIFVNAGNPAGDADTLSNFVGNCPPAGTVVIGTGMGNVVCGDDALVLTNVPPGTYTLVVSDANNVPFAVDPGPPVSTLLSDGFLDLTAGAFQTCNITSDGTFCITPNNHFAVDIVDTTGPFLSVIPPIITKVFGDSELQLIGPSNTTTLSFTITNPAPTTLMNVGFTDMLPSGLIVSTPAGLTGSCDGGIITAAAGSNSISLSGATLDPSATCSFSLSVTATALGIQTNTTSPIAFNGGLSGPPAMATTSVDASFFAWFFSEGGGGGSH
jgi:uncharacterized repeat protein (TIGR01451 family)